MLVPQVEGAYARIFEQITQGVREHPEITVHLYTVTKNTSPEEIESWLEGTMAQAVLALGRRSYRLAAKLDIEAPIVVGALVVPPNGYPTISLAGDPDEFFTRLATLAPGVKRVFTVYNPKSSSWLIREAEISARKHGLELVSYAADDMRDGMHHYRAMLETARGSSDAIWLPMDKVVPEKTVLPMVLDAAWKHRLVVFSSNPLSAKKGALFALYPDYERMGEELAKLAITQVRENPEPRLIPSRNLRIAVNQRTASHLGFNYPQSLQRSFDLIYPSPR